MEKHKLVAQKRKLEGRKVKSLRREGILPANVFGKEFKSLSVQVPIKEFLKVYEQAGETGIIDLSVGDGETHPVLIHNLQIHPVTSAPLHVDFHKVLLTEKVKAMIPVEIIGEAPAVAQKLGLLLTPVSEIEVEAFPQDLLENIQVDVKNLSQVGQEIKIKDLKVSDKVTILTDPELVVVQIGELITEEAKKMMEEEKAQAEAAAAAAGTETPAAETPAEGETATEVKPEEEKPQEEKK